MRTSGRYQNWYSATHRRVMPGHKTRKMFLAIAFNRTLNGNEVRKNAREAKFVMRDTGNESVDGGASFTTSEISSSSKDSHGHVQVVTTSFAANPTPTPTADANTPPPTQLPRLRKPCRKSSDPLGVFRNHKRCQRRMPNRKPSDRGEDLSFNSPFSKPLSGNRKTRHHREGRRRSRVPPTADSLFQVNRSGER